MYYPHTSLLFKQDSKEANKFLKNLLKNQVVTTTEYMWKNSTYKGSKPYYYKHGTKIRKIKTCKRYAEMYNGISNTISSNIYFVDKVININEEKNITKKILDFIAEKISQGKIIDYKQLKEKFKHIDDEIMEIVSAHNDSLVKGNSSDSDYSYKDLIAKYEECKEELLKHKKLIEKLEEKNSRLTDMNNQLKSDNDKLSEEREQIKRILK